MKNMYTKLTKAIVTVAKRGVKDDINSTGSPWAYQPKMPKTAQEFKKASK